jgi:hypothetical protein
VLAWQTPISEFNFQSQTHTQTHKVKIQTIIRYQLILVRITKKAKGRVDEGVKNGDPFPLLGM